MLVFFLGGFYENKKGLQPRAGSDRPPYPAAAATVAPPPRPQPAKKDKSRLAVILAVLLLALALLFTLPFSRFFHVIMSPVIVAYNTVADAQARGAPSGGLTRGQP